MLPSFRLIAATFCCGFLLVFAGVRLAATFNSVNQALPVTAAHAAAVPIAALSDQEQRHQRTNAMPVTYDLRFAVSAAQPSPAADRMPPLLMPLVILPPIAQDTNETKATTTVAALPSRPAAEAQPITIDIPLPEPATVDLTFSPLPAKPKDNPVTAVATATPPAQATPLIDIPLPDPVAVDLTFSPAAASSTPAAAEPAAEIEPRSIEPRSIGPKSEAAPSPLPETDARADSAHEHDAPITIAALAEEIPLGAVKLPAKHIPLPKPKAPKRTAAVHPAAPHHAARHVAAKPKPKPKPRRQAFATGPDFENFFNFPPGKPR